MADIPTTMEVIYGDTPTFTGTVTANGVAVNITGYTIYFTVRDTPDFSDTTDAKAAVATTATLTTPASGLFSLALTSAMTSLEPGTYYYNIRIKKGSTLLSSKNGIYSVLNGSTQRT